MAKNYGDGCAVAVFGDQWWLTIPSGENKLLTFTETLNARHTRLAWVNLELLCHISTDWVISDINIHYRQENEGVYAQKVAFKP